MSLIQEDGVVRDLIPGELTDVTFSTDGRTMYGARDGSVVAYDVANGIKIGEWEIGKTLGAIDASLDGRYVVATETVYDRSATGEVSVYVYRLDVTTGESETFTWRSSGYVANFHDVTFLSDGTALMTQNFPGSGWVPLTTLNFDTAVFTSGRNTYAQSGTLTANAAKDTVLFLPSNISDAPVHVYKVGTGVTASHGGYADGVSGFNWGVQAISNDGTKIVQGMGLNLYDGDLKYQGSLATRYAAFGQASGLAFSPDGSELYVLSPNAQGVFVLDTTTWDIVRSFYVENIPSTRYGFSDMGNTMLVSPEGGNLTIIGSESLKVVNLAAVVSTLGTSRDDAILGDSADNVLYGFEGNDRIDGGAGADRMSGGLGDDVYIVDNGNDYISENQREGYDTVYASVNYALSSNVERLVLTGGATDGTGSSGNDTIIGNDLNNRLSGGAGDDRLEGGAGDDILIGGPGVDVLVGGTGNDTYYLEGFGDQAVELVGEGIDKIIALGTVTMSDHIEILEIATGNATINATGNAQDNLMTGNAGDNRLFGMGGNDTLIGGLGNDHLDGGAGHDITRYDALRGAASVTYTGGGQLTIGTAVAGADTLMSVEEIRFQDGILWTGADSNAAVVTRMYHAVLGRRADDGGLDFWLDQMNDESVSTLTLAGAFLNSAEFQASGANVSDNTAFVQFIYQATLGREADESGLANWVGELDRGRSREEVLLLFSESAEHRGQTADMIAAGMFETDNVYQDVALLYDSFLGRLPDAGGLVNWAEQIKAGAFTLEAVADLFAASSEFQAKIAGFDNGQLVDYIYQTTLDRAPEPEGRANWVFQLDNGISEGDLLLLFAKSAEHQGLMFQNITGGIDVI